MEAVKKIISGTKTLIAPPDVWFRFNEAVNSNSSTIHDIAEIIKTDPSLVANVLKVVNSPFYGIRNRIDTISRAISIIGMDDLYNIITSVVAVNSFSNIATNLVKPATFWRHSFCTAILAKKIARHCNVLHTERLYVVGLLHDIGSLLLYATYPGESEEIIKESSGDEELHYRLEQKMLGFTHADIGAELLKEWGLPDSLTESIRNHHEPCKDEELILDKCIIHLANALSNCYILGTYLEALPEKSNTPDACIWDYITLSDEDKSEIYDGLDEELADAISILIPYNI
jgi:putative nucleotidyltransferase with HDIG domain